MPLRRFLIVSATALGFAFGGLAGAEEDKRSTAKPSTQPIKGAGSPQSEGKPSAVLLKGEIRLTPAGQRGASARGLVRQIKFDKINKLFAELSGNAKLYEMGVNWMPDIAKACDNKAYTAQDQKAAGCIGTESQNQCMDKLYKYCLENWSVAGISPPKIPDLDLSYGGQSPGYSTKQFKEAAQASAAQARALSQILNQYANQAEQNAKAFSP